MSIVDSSSVNSPRGNHPSNQGSIGKSWGGCGLINQEEKVEKSSHTDKIIKNNIIKSTLAVVVVVAAAAAALYTPGRGRIDIDSLI